ncbi:MAG: hypothetical protein HGA23_00500, partial [Bacteroidales bacterium]|nr:hypothetical protein [Bacteroidales bacterium]
LKIDHLILFDVELGNLDISSFAYLQNEARFSLSLIGAQEDISMVGTWNSDEGKEPFDIDLEINHLNIAELNYLLSDYISDAKGLLTGSLKVTGSPEKPLVNGVLNFRDAGMGIAYLNNYFTFGDETIKVKDNVIDFNKLSIVNKQDQSARIMGTISVDPDGNSSHDLRIETDNMVLMNTTHENNDMLFGLLRAQADIEIKGTLAETRISAAAEIDKSTNITYIFPDELSLDDNHGVVEFVDFDADTLIMNSMTEGSVFASLFSLKNMKTTIDIDRGAHFKILFDPAGSDYLDATLNGRVNYNVSEGNNEVSGMLEIESGKLKYGIPMVNVEEFDIEPGSSLSISNDLYNPYLNIIASSKVRASTESLMSNYSKVMNFKVLLHMTGELNDVKLRFDISTETDDALVSSRLAQLTEEERNMNALNLLVRGSFVISVKSDEAGSNSMNDAMMDKFYAEQLNHLISENINFVDVSFDVQSFKDYNTSGDLVFQRNYYYNVGKSFLDDRARINYKGSMGITSDLQAEQVNSQFVQNELEFEVKITRNGEIRAVFFRKNQYEGLLEGEMISTGGGIRLKKDFYSLEDVFVNELRQGNRKNR